MCNCEIKSELLSVVEAAAMLDRTRGWYYQQLDKKRVPGYKIGGVVYITRASMEHHLNEITRLALMGIDYNAPKRN